MLAALVSAVALVAALTWGTAPRRGCAAAAAAPLRAVAPAAGVLAAAPAVIIGVSANVRSASRDARCAIFARLHVAGVHWIREDLSWAQAEPQPARLLFDRYDRLVLTAAAAGIDVLPLIDDTPAWAGPSSEALPDDPRAFAEFVAAAAARYGPGGTLWLRHPDVPPHPVRWLELYNEPYLHHQSPARYAKLVRAAATAARAADVKVAVLAVTNDSPWLTAMYAAVPDLFRYAAAAAVHPYSTLAPDAPPAPDTTRGLEQVHATMAAHGDGGIPIWITEIGWPTCIGSPDCVSEAVQADDLRSAFALAATAWSGYVRALFLYDLSDYLPQPAGDKEPAFGLLRADGSPKPALGVLMAATGGAR